METIKVLTQHAGYEVEGTSYSITEGGLSIVQQDEVIPGEANGKRSVVAVFRDWLVIHTADAKLKRVA